MNNQSWFYLTIWHGTPADFRTEYSIDVCEAQNAVAEIGLLESASSEIQRNSFGAVDISTQHNAHADITIKTEVVWYVS